MTLVCDARVVLVSDHRLVAETVAAALRRRGVETGRLGCAARPGTAAGAEVGLVLSGLDQTIGVGEVRSLVLEVPIPWIVVTTASRGAWGAVLEALTVLDRTTSIDDVVATIAGARAGRFSIDADLRRRLERDQRAAADELDRLGDRLSSFTPAERSLLHPTCVELAAGEAIPQEAADRRQRLQVSSVLHDLDRADYGAQVAMVRASARRRMPRPGCRPRRVPKSR